MDIGNTNATLGVWRGDRLGPTWKVAVQHIDELDECWESEAGGSGLKPDATVVASVNPKVTGTLLAWVERRLGHRARVFREDLPVPMSVRCDRPEEVGADRLVGAYAAWRRTRGACIVVDFGTAITFDVVSPEGAYEGGLIVPGIRLSALTLFHATALLPYIDVRAREGVVGRNSADAINNGIYWGFIGLVDSLLDRLAAEMGGSPRLLATGGDAPLIVAGTRSRPEVVPHLTLEGLRLCAEESRT